MNAISDFDISAILNGLYRRKGLIIATFLVVSILGAYLAITVPNVFQSSALILVSPQRVPTSYVASTVTIDLAERMQSSIQEILSRTQLEKIIQEFNLFPNAKQSTLEERIEGVRKKIKVELRKKDVFQLSFESGDPEKARQVTSKIASLFIDQNIQVREQQAMGTKTFINSEADRLRNELEEQEAAVNQYKAANRYELPDQLDSNLRSLEQFRRELESATLRLTGLQERKGVLQKQSVESDILGLDLLGGGGFLGGGLLASGDSGTQNLQMEMKKRELDTLLQKYSNKHPDVMRLQTEIRMLEGESKNRAPTPTKSSAPATPLPGNPLKQVLQSQITDIDAEIQAVRSQIERIKSQVGALQARVENTPLRAIELSKISRGYDITLRKYQDLLGKSLESELSENMEKKQKGEQFQILDPANLPLKPVRPNRMLIVLAGLVLGMGGGVALAFLWNNFDTSFRQGDEINSLVNVPLLASLPALMTRGSVVEQRRAQGVLVLASVGVLGIGLILVRVFGPLYF